MLNSFGGGGGANATSAAAKALGWQAHEPGQNTLEDKPESEENTESDINDEDIQPATEDMTLANSRRQFKNGGITEKQFTLIKRQIKKRDQLRKQQQEDAKTPNEKTAVATTALHKLTEKLQQVITGLKRTKETAPTIELLKHHIKRTEDSRKELSKLGSMKKTQRNHQVNLKALKTALHEANKINEQAETTMLSAEAACM